MPPVFYDAAPIHISFAGRCLVGADDALLLEYGAVRLAEDAAGLRDAKRERTRTHTRRLRLRGLSEGSRSGLHIMINDRLNQRTFTSG